MIGRLRLILVPLLLAAQTPQNPSPMVEHTRPHPRVKETTVPGSRYGFDGATLFVPRRLGPRHRLLVFFHGGTWLPEVAASENRMAVITAETAEPAELLKLLAEAQRVSHVRFNRLILGGWSAGCGTIRGLLHDPEIYNRVNGVLCIDGMHTGYTHGTPGPLESDIDTSKLQIWVRLAKAAIAGQKRFVVTHSEIFPGTFASTTETADYLLSEVGLKVRPVLKQGPMSTQQLSEARAAGSC